MKKTKNVWKKFALQNPKNLEREVHIYGYHYSWRTHSISILGTSRSALRGQGSQIPLPVPSGRSI